MRTLRYTGLVLLAGIALSGRAAHAVDTMGDDDDATAELKEHHRHHHHGGVTQFIAMSLDTLGEDEAKRPTIEAIQDKLHGCTRASREDEKGLMVALADGIGAGNIDTKKVDPALVQLRADAGRIQECDAAALNELHAALSPIERRALVHKVEAHWAVWKHVNHDAPAGGREAGGRLHALQRELNLTPDQLDKMSAALQAAMQDSTAHFDHAKVQAHIKAFGDAFVKDAFDANSLASVNANADLAHHGARRMVVFYETIMPILTPEQRTTLAEHLREHASHQPGQGG
jgi:Spy/CpxP family protein refolding chaperone